MPRPTKFRSNEGKGKERQVMRNDIRNQLLGEIDTHEDTPQEDRYGDLPHSIEQLNYRC